jgi:hypothetical protein
MKMNRIWKLAVVSSLSIAATLNAQESTPSTLYPKSTILYVGGKSIQSAADHSTYKNWLKSSNFRDVWRSPEVMKGRGAITFFEFATGTKLDQLLYSLTTNGYSLGIDSQTKGIALVLETKDEAWLSENTQKWIQLARDDAKRKSEPNPVEEKEYRGLTGYKWSEAIVVELGSKLLVSNKTELAKQMVDRYLDQTDDGFRIPNSGDQPASDSSKLADVWIDLQSMRSTGIAKELLNEMPRDFGGELILGGLLHVLTRAEELRGELRWSDNGIAMRTSVPTRESWLLDKYEFYVGPDQKGKGKEWVADGAMMASLTTYRDAAQLWLRAGDLLSEQANEQLAQADNTLTTLFSGKDFGTDILSAIEPEIQLVVAPQAFEPKTVPSIQLPAFAVIAKLKDPKGMRRELKRTFQSFVGFLNIVGAMEGQPQLDLDNISEEGITAYTSTYLAESDKKYEQGLPIQFNFSPSIAFHEDLVCISSTKELAVSVFRKNAATSPSQSDTNPVHTKLQIDAKQVRKILEANREQLIAQNMLEKGHNRDEAESEINNLFLFSRLVESINLALRFADQGNTVLDLGLQLIPNP